ncbi:MULTISPECIES: cell envelope biogenesis protein OmpA [unclassified Algibacter]|uniref:cell envelope biogenesis protein OmpA n=1 Tax=unclassified Algibacter TaxID=2615009 RepID=UPI00131B4655|nr:MULTISPECIES: cell envelope biogenesis protein OmpA [unclassified Algibacter]MCL5130021.1 cell envelope biogenesis protein OmpA [Algibacter sp. L4_22]
MNQDEKLSIIKDILLNDEREFASSIEKKIKILEETLNNHKNLSTKIDPIIDEKITAFINEMPDRLGATITEALKKEIKNSQDAVVEALFPILGKMVKRYVQHEMKLLSEKINNQVNNTFSFKRFFRKAKSKASGVDESDIMIQEQTNTKIEQVIIIEKGSGIVLAEFSKDEMADEDMVAGMLTAIKSFVEDAFKKESQNLQYIEYDLYHIHLQNFSSFYMAVVVSGAYNIIFKDKLEDKILEFINKQKVPSILNNKILLTKKLEDFFENDSI